VAEVLISILLYNLEYKFILYRHYNILWLFISFGNDMRLHYYRIGTVKIY